MSDLRQAAQAVADAWNGPHPYHPEYGLVKAFIALETALAASSNIEAVSTNNGQGQKMDVPQRQPLTQRRIFQLAALSGCGSYQSDYDAQIKYDRCLEQFARAIEKAHNIGGAT